MQKHHPNSTLDYNQAKNNIQSNPPNQNININISYNLNTNKLPKSLLAGKKITHKNKKVPTNLFTPFNQQIINNLSTDHNGKKLIKKQSLNKKIHQIQNKQIKINEKKPNKKKKNNLATIQLQPQSKNQIIEYYNPLANNSKDFLKRNIQSPDIFKPEQNRKIKTQTSCMDFNSTFKKIKKLPPNSGYLQDKNNIPLKQPQTGGVYNNQSNKANTSNLINLLNKKSIISNSTSKTPKNKKSLSTKQRRFNTHENEVYFSNAMTQSQNHNKSCMLYSTKKNLQTNNIEINNCLDSADHVMSTFVNVNNSKKARKRAQSEYTFKMKNDKKLLSKLLNMSIIQSEGLGSSQLISSQRMKSARNGITRKNLGLRVDEIDQYHLGRNEVNNIMRKEKQSTQQRQKNIKQRQENINERQENIHGNALRQYLNSIDMRIIKSIEDDTQKLLYNINYQKTSKQNSLNQTKLIPANKSSKKLFMFNQSNQKDQFSILAEGKDMISYYNQLFTNVLQNKKLQEQKYLNQSDLKKNISLNSSDLLKKQKFFIEAFDSSDDNQLFEINFVKRKDQQNKMNLYDNKEEENQKQIKNSTFKLNFQNYKNIISKGPTQSRDLTQNFHKSISQNNKNKYKEKQSFSNQDQHQNKNDNISPQNSYRSNKLSSFKQQQIQRWNNINRILSEQISNKSQKDEQTYSQKIMQELMKQSDINKKWMQQEQIDHYDQQQVIQQMNRGKKYKKSNKGHSKSKSGQVFSISKNIDDMIWQYDEEQLNKEIQQNYQQKNKNLSQNIKINNYLNSKGLSEDGGIGSGQQLEYDNKKYSENTSLFKNQDSAFKNQNAASKNQDKITKNQQKINKQNHSFQEEDQDQYELSQLNSDLRGWIDQEKIFYNNNQQTKQERLKQEDQNNNQNKKSNYLECELSQFGFQCANKIKSHTKKTEQQNKQEKNGQIIQNQIIQVQQELSISFKVYPITQPTQKCIDKTQSLNLLCSQIHKKRLTHIVQDIILILIKQFARDISIILKKTSTMNKEKNHNFSQKQIQENTSPLKDQLQNSIKPNQQDNFNHENNKNQQAINNKRNNFVAKSFGVDTSFMSIQKYLKKFKQFILERQNIKNSILININKDIGPNSLQILSYLRPEYNNNEDQNEDNPIFEGPNNQQNEKDNQNDDNLEDEDGLFVVPSDTFESFQDYMENQREEMNKNLQPEKQINYTNRQKAYLNFWHRSIFESYNEFLDFQRPYGINGKPYDWVQERKKFRQVQMSQLQQKLQKGIQKLMQAMSLTSGIIFDKFDCPIMYGQLSQEQKMILNQERLSRMLAIQLFESEQSWINYNDEMAQLLVELSRMIEQRIYLQMSTELKKVKRKRNLLVALENGQQSNSNQEDELKEDKIYSQVQ